MKTANFLHAAGACALLAALCAPGAALAQYVWVDENGIKQFSDMPPPASVPNSRILKQPGSAPRSAPDANDAGTAPANAPKSATELNAEFKKRRAEQAEKEKKAAEEAKLAEEKKKNCERAREHHQALESGQRISRTAANGDRALLTDEQRTQELREARQILNDCK